jgi:hypothetical protein
VSKFLVQEGHGDEVLLLVQSNNSEAAHQQLAMVGEAIVGAEQSSKEAAAKWCMGEAEWVVASFGDV